MLPSRRTKETPEGTRIKKGDHNKGTQWHTQTSTKATDAPGARRDIDHTEETHVVGLGSNVACHTTKSITKCTETTNTVQDRITDVDTLHGISQWST